jgi:hypothetical protein
MFFNEDHSVLSLIVYQIIATFVGLILAMLTFTPFIFTLSGYYSITRVDTEVERNLKISEKRFLLTNITEFHLSSNHLLQYHKPKKFTLRPKSHPVGVHFVSVSHPSVPDNLGIIKLADSRVKGDQLKRDLAVLFRNMNFVA